MISAGDTARDAVLATSRLELRRLTPDDAPFIVALLNDPDWLRFIGDRGVYTEDDARGYIERGPIAMYARHGYGPYLVVRRDDGIALGICGLIKRDTLPDVDVGFAFLPAYRGAGYAVESAMAVMAEASKRVGLSRVVAIASPDNGRSLRLLEKLGMAPEGAAPGSSADDPTVLYARALP